MPSSATAFRTASIFDIPAPFASVVWLGLPFGMVNPSHKSKVGVWPHTRHLTAHGLHGILKLVGGLLLVFHLFRLSDPFLHCPTWNVTASLSGTDTFSSQASCICGKLTGALKAITGV